MVDLPGRIRGNIYYFETASGMIIWANIDFKEKTSSCKVGARRCFLLFGFSQFRANEREKRRLSQTDHHMKCTPNARLFVQHLG